MALKDKILAKAQKYMLKGNIDKALAEYRNAVDIDPRDISIRLRIGDLYVKTNRTEEAIKEYTEVARGNAQRGFYPKAIAVYKKVLKLDDSNLDVHYKLAELYTKQRLIADAISSYSYIVSTFEKLGKTTEVVELLKKMLEIDPDNVGVRLKLADLFLKLSFDKDAVAEYANIFEKLIAEGKVDRAEKVFLSLNNSRPNEPVILDSLAKIYKSKGDNEKFAEYARPLLMTYKKNEDVGAALELSKSILEVYPDDAAALDIVHGVEPPELIHKEPEAEETTEAPAAHTEAPEPAEEATAPAEDFSVAESRASDDEAAKEAAEETGEEAEPEDDTLISWPEEDIEISVEGFDEDEDEEASGEPVEDALKDEEEFVVAGEETPENEEPAEAKEEAPVEDFSVAESLPTEDEVVEADDEQPEVEASTPEAAELEAAPEEAEQEAEVEIDLGDYGMAGSEPSASVEETAEEPAEEIEEAQEEVAEEPAPVEEPVVDEETPVEVAAEEAVEIEEEVSVEEPVEEPAEEIEEAQEEVAEEPAPVEEPAVEEETPVEAAAEEAVEIEEEPASEETPVEEVAEEEVFFEESAEEPVEEIEEAQEEVAEEPAPVEEPAVEEETPVEAAAEEAVEIEEEPAPEETPVEEVAEEEIAEEEVFFEEPVEEPTVEPAEKIEEAQEEVAEEPAIEEETPVAVAAEEPVEAEAEVSVEENEETQVEDFSVAESRPTEDEVAEEEVSVEEPVAEEPAPVEEPVVEEEVPVAAAVEEAFEIEEEPAPEEAPVEEVVEEEIAVEESLEDEPVEDIEEAASEETPAEEPLETLEPEPSEPIEERIERVLAEEPFDVELDVLDSPESGAEAAGEPVDIEEPAPEPVPEVDESSADSLDSLEMDDELSSAIEELQARMDTGEELLEPDKVNVEDSAPETEFIDLSAELGMEEALEGLAGTWTQSEGESTDAFDEYKDGIGQQLSKEDTETHYNLGIAYMEMELFDEASKEFKIALKEPRLEGDCYARLGLCAMAESKPDEAVVYYLKGLKVEGKSEDERKGMMYELALAYEAADDIDEAFQLFTSINELDPGYREVSEKLAAIDLKVQYIPSDDGLIEVELL